MVARSELCHYLDELLKPSNFQDYCPNGLQVEGNTEIKKLVTGVTACQALIDAASEVGADALLVHHGFFWKGENPCIAGPKKQRLNKLLTNNINLIAYHLPLDAEPEFGNNIQLGIHLNLQNIDAKQCEYGAKILFTGELLSPLSPSEFAQQIEKTLSRTPQHIAPNDKPIQRIAWCTGGADKLISAAAALDVDAFISGEISEPTYHLAQELNIHYFAAGHHATERYGVQALGEHLKATFGIEHQFIDIDNPV